MSGMNNNYEQNDNPQSKRRSASVLSFAATVVSAFLGLLLLANSPVNASTSVARIPSEPHNPAEATSVSSSMPGGARDAFYHAELSSSASFNMGQQSGASPQCTPAWQIVPSYNSPYGNTTLPFLTVIAANDIWAFGTEPRQQGDTRGTFYGLHWNGYGWQHYDIEQSLQTQGFAWIIFDVAAASSNSVWAVGYYGHTRDDDAALIVHWNGTVWSIVLDHSSPNWRRHLNSIAAASEDTVWATGRTGTYLYPYGWQELRTAYTTRTDGTWYENYIVDGGNITAMTADRNSRKIWAVDITGEALVRRPGGSEWETMRNVCGPWGNACTIDDMSSTSDTDIWAAGKLYYQNRYYAFLSHWNGTQWTTAVPNFPQLTNVKLTGVTAVTSSNVWTVGTATYSGAEVSFFGQCSGLTSCVWELAPQSSSGPDFLGEISHASASDIWAVGLSHSTSPYSTLIERFYCVGPCTLQFTDVPPDNTFYPYVRCLACRGIDRGYACGGPGEPCDPNNNNYWHVNYLITRDDIAHMVAASAGFAEDPGPQRFQDVPTTHPYFAWINRMAIRGLIGGYPCGGPGEPCIAPQNLAYYRPSAYATRGQIAKIVSNGAGFNDPPVGQMFEDVPAAHPFYDWVQRLASRGVMGGYPCGGVNEPCGAGNKPYFRWGNLATRGQVGKITANTFFPNCQTP